VTDQLTQVFDLPRIEVYQMKFFKGRLHQQCIQRTSGHIFTRSSTYMDSGPGKCINVRVGEAVLSRQYSRISRSVFLQNLQFDL